MPLSSLKKSNTIIYTARNELENPKFVFTERTEVRVGGLKIHC